MKASFADTDHTPDDVFMYIYKLSLPPDATKAHADAVMTLMAYYFECCDIFESPEG